VSEARRQGRKEGIAQEWQRWDQVTLHSAVKGRPELERQANLLLGRTDKSPQEILWFLMGRRPLLVKS
jgi:hypothetical protein